MLHTPLCRRIAGLLDSKATPLGLWLALAVAVLCQAAMMPLDRHLHLVSGGLGKPSLLFAAHARDLLAHLQAFGIDGRRTLTRLYLLDLIFPTALALAAIQAYWLAFRRVAPGLALGLALVAVGFDALDLIEKLSSFALLYHYPQVTTGWLTFTVTVTTTKLVCLGGLYAGLLAALMGWGLARLRFVRTA